MLQEVAHDNNFNLTETVYSQFTTHHSLKKAAFTLAEVLITLGIIGVVAAITLPTLIKNYQKQVYVTQLKKVVNTLENNSRKILADEGVDSLQDTPLYSPDLDDKRSFKLNKDYFEKHYKLTPLSETTEYTIMIKSIFDDFGFTDNYYSNDGACITTLNGQSSITLYDHFDIIVDINCAKRPNKVGYDRFIIRFNDNNGSLDATCDSLWELDTCTSENLELEGNELHKFIVAGSTCFCKIVQDGWKMNY